MPKAATSTPSPVRVKNEPYARPSTSATPPARSSSDIDRPDPSEEPEYKPDVVSDDDEYSDHKTTPKAKSKAKAKAKPKGKGSNDDAPASPFKAGKGEYNKGLLVALIFAVSFLRAIESNLVQMCRCADGVADDIQQPATPDWEVIGNNVGLSKSRESSPSLCNSLLLSLDHHLVRH